MKKILVIISLLICALYSYGQNITTEIIDNGPYGSGSSIAVQIKLDERADFFKTDNEFRLYLSDANGNFGSETVIGSFSGFYSTFINGTLPSALPAGNYRVRVKSTSPAVASAASAPFEVKSDNGVQASIDAPPQQIIGSNNNTAFGYCTPGKNNARFNFSNTSTAGASVTAIVRNENNPADITSLSFTSNPQTFISKITHYTVLVKAELDGIIGTRAYFLINNMINTPFNPPGSSTVCLPLGELEYNVETASTNGIQLNFPGNTYQVTWGDGKVEMFNLNKIKAADGKIRHLYTLSSCGSQITIGSIRYYNVFGIVVQTVSPFCGNIGVPVSSQAKVISQPENRFAAPAVSCVNTPLTISNGSIAGEDPSVNSPSCQNNNVVYYWYVDDILLTPQGVSPSWQLKHTFTSSGFHKIRLESESTSECQAAPVEKTIYVQKAPVPDFSLNGNVFCTGTPVKPENESVTDTSSLAIHSYKWTINGPAPVAFLSNTSDTTQNPEFAVTKAGVYTIKLSISSSCETISTEEQTFIVNERPSITVSWPSNLCGKGQLLTFNDTEGNPARTSFSGTFNESADTYNWSVSGGSYSFENNTNASSKVPDILFRDYGSYTISVTHTNNCGISTESRTITFNESPTINAGSDQTVCAGTGIILEGTITGPPVSSFQWKGGTGTFSPGRNVLNPSYIPSASEIAAGKVELILSAVTMNPAPCNMVEDVVIITINPQNKISGASQKTICTGSTVNYQPVSTVKGSTFRWTATGSANATGFNTSGTGNINDVITNTDLNQNAVVTYIIIPESNGCDGEAFTLTVNVSPLPVISANVVNSSICTGQPAAVQLSSNLKDTRYRWSSITTGNILGNTVQNTPVGSAQINDILTNTGNTPGTVTYTVVPVTTSGCEGQPASVTITISAPPVKANAGADQNLCNESATQLNGNNPGEGMGQWTLQSGQTGVTFDDESRFDAAVSGLAPGQTYRFLWTISGPFNCQASNDEVVIRVLPPLATNRITATTETICQGNDIIIDGSLPTGGDGNYTYIWETSINGIDWAPLNTISTRGLRISATDTTWFRRTVNSGECSSYSNTVKVNVQKSISNNSITDSQYICSGVIPAKLSGSLPLGANGIFEYQWEKKTDNNGNWTAILNAKGQDYQPEALTETTQYRRVVTTALCTGLQQSVSNIITIKVSPGPHARFTWTSDASCAPFIISDRTVKAEDSESGDTYIWLVNDRQVGTGRDFPGLTLHNPGDSAVIKLRVTSGPGCGSAEFSHTFRTSSALTADFTADKTKGCGPLAVTFTNTTFNTQDVAFEWNFGNGKSSTANNPSSITFESRNDGKDTVYTVTLTATSKCLVSSKTLDIKVTGQAIAVFAPDKTTGCSPLTVTFKNKTQGAANTYIWDFGDGTEVLTTTADEPVSHIYTSSRPKMYTVKLKVVNECNTDESSFIVNVSPNTVVPDLIVNGNEYEGCAPHSVRFINNTTGASVYTYDFGDGSALYTTNNPGPVSHSFTRGGTFVVRMTASNGCSDTTTTKTIKVYPQAVTNFSADATSGCGSLTVKFTNNTTGATSYLWDFGDGTTSDNPNPIHTYASRTIPYRVKLISTTSFGCSDTLELKDYITVVPPPVADFDVLPDAIINYPKYTFNFRDESKGDIVSRNWDFGDESAPSPATDPEHTYPDTGSYKVKLTVTSSQGCTNTFVRTVRISGVPGSLFVPNAFMPNSVSEELRSFKVKGSGLEKWHMRIFNKWGELLWQTQQLDERGVPSDSWDGNVNGSPVPQGVYFWEISATFKNGTEWAGMTYNTSEPKRTGAIHLIR